jgi:transaldolase
MIEFMLDTANIDAINRLVDTCPVAGITGNPGILKLELN